MLQLDHSYSFPALFDAGVTTSSYIPVSDSDGDVHILSKHVELLHKQKHEGRHAFGLTIIDEMVIIGFQDGEILTVQIASRTPGAAFPKVHQDAICSLKILAEPNGSKLVSSDYSGLIILWDVEQRNVLHTFRGHTQGIPNNNFSTLPGQNVLISGSWDGSIRIWDLDIGLQKAVLELPDREERAVRYRDKVYKETVSVMLVLDDGRIIAGGLSGIVRVWNSTTGSLTTSWQAHFNGNKITGPVLNNILLHPSGVAFITTGTDGAVCLWDMRTYSLLRSIKPLEHSVLAVGWHGMTLICGGKDGGGVDNACGAFNKIVTWNVAQLRLEDGTEEKYEQLGPLCQSVRKIWSFGRHVAILAMRKGLTGVEMWSEEGS